MGTGPTPAADLLTLEVRVRRRLVRAVAAPPAEVPEGFGDDLRPVERADAGYFAADLAHSTVIRRVRVEAGTISADPRSRRRRTIDCDQLALVLDGIADHGWAASG